ncbi:universal stress protein [Streptomyces olivaceoviridis]|uniref:universal stress protein n=1 Tax=Streptomyces olivaceoviridis TaxID=1921 RepID=UPI0033A2D75F
MVGVDGSEQSKAALRWAVAQAELTTGAVEAVFAWQNPYYWYGWSPPEEEPFDFEEQSRTSLARAIVEAIGFDRPVRVTGSTRTSSLRSTCRHSLTFHRATVSSDQAAQPAPSSVWPPSATITRCRRIPPRTCGRRTGGGSVLWGRGSESANHGW